jgi:hypothetical protein
MLSRFGLGSRPVPDDADACLQRSTSPAAKMTLILRFETERGPRTILAPEIPLALASEITREMIRAGHFAEFVDQLPPLSVAKRVKARRDCQRTGDRGFENRSPHSHRSAAA